MTQIDLKDMYRTFHPKTKEYTLFLLLCGTFSKTDHLLSNKVNLNGYNKIVVSSCILSDNHSLMLEFNNTTLRKPSNSWIEQWTTEPPLCQGRNREKN